jgi:ribosomal protein S18 acetylase RimI-like enzyme
MTSTNSVAIRPAVRADIPAIENVARLSWATAYDGLIPPDIQDRAIAAWYSDEALATAIESLQSLFLLAERIGQVVGFVNLQVSPGIVYLARIYVLPGNHRLGIGTHLLQVALAMVPNETDTVTVDVEEGNIHARAFYEKLGFVPSGARMVELFGFDLPLVRYQKQLNRTAA